MPAPAAAEAASYFADAVRLADKDLVDLPAAEQKKEIDALKRAGAAPAAVKDKSGEEAVAYLQAQKGRRTELQARIQTLQKQRERFLRAQPGATADAFDEKVVQNLREQAAQQAMPRRPSVNLTRARGLPSLSPIRGRGQGEGAGSLPADKRARQRGRRPPRRAAGRAFPR